MTCLEAPGLVIEKQRLAHIGGTFSGIVGDENHVYGYHVCDPSSDDYSSQGPLNEPVGPYSTAIDIGMDWDDSRNWLAWLITEIREDRITGIAEVIGALDGRDVRYWSDIETPDWDQSGVPYQGEGHDAWTHVGVYRSTANQDHGILKGWETPGGPGNGGEYNMSDYSPLGPPDAVKLEDGTVRGDSILLADLWNLEQRGLSPYDGSQSSARQQQLDRIEDMLKALTAKK